METLIKELICKVNQFVHGGSAPKTGPQFHRECGECFHYTLSFENL